jgi:hypothetical protein
LAFWRESLNDDQSPAAARTGEREDTGMFIHALDGITIIMICIWRLGPKKIPDRGDIGGAVAITEEPVMADAMLAFWEHMDEEPTDKLSCFQRHGLVPTGAFDTVIFDTEGDATPIHADQAAI